MFKKMLHGDICVYYLILMIFVFVDVCMCVCVCVCMCVCIYFNFSYLRNESTDFRRVKQILFVSRENKGTLMDLRLYWFSFVI